MASRDMIAKLVDSAREPSTNEASRATSPGGGWRESNGDTNDITTKRHRARTFPYERYLPYATEDESERQRNLEECLEQLYVAVSAGDFAPGAVYWTREIRGWLALKFDLTLDQRAKLVKLYYELTLAPGLDPSVSERFASMFMVLLKRKQYLRPGKDLILDWRPLFKEIKAFVLPAETGLTHSTTVKRNIRTITRLCTFLQMFIDPSEIPNMLEEFLPYFSASWPENAFVVAGLLNLFFPTTPAPAGKEKLQPQYYIPTFFHIWSLVNRSKVFDVHFIDLFSRLARDSLSAKHIPFSEHGIFTNEQASLMFTTILRLIEIPVGQDTSPYTSFVDMGAGLALILERDPKKHPVPHHIARLVVMSLSPLCLDKPDSVMARLEGLIQAVETFFHPSNSGSWTKTLAHLVYYLTDFFVMRWNREKNGEMDTPEDRKLNDRVKRRFVLCLREVVFMGIYSKSATAMNFALSSLKGLAYLEPELILPGALQRIYPAMQGSVEVHRTTSSIRALHGLTSIMTRTKGFRCHVTTLLALALPGIDANDLEKTQHTLAYMQTLCYNIPLADLTKEKLQAVSAEDSDDSNAPAEPDRVQGSDIAITWIRGEVERLEREGAGVNIDYETELTDVEEHMILRSSTAGFAEFLIALFGRVFTLLENLPDASRLRTGSPEENIINTLPATFSPLLASLSEELFDVALNKITNFVFNHVIHQARDATAFMVNCFCKIRPKKSLGKLIPGLIQAIRTEIDDNGAGSSRTTGSEVLPRDRGLVWYISLLSMCVVHVGDAVLDFKKELSGIALYMQQNCRGIPTLHVSNFIHHLLLNLTTTYTVDYSLYERDVLERGVGPRDWGNRPDPQGLDIAWHIPSQEEIAFSVELFKTQVGRALQQLKLLTSDASVVKRDGVGRDWSDEVSRNLVLLRLVLSGISILFDPNYGRQQDHVNQNGIADGEKSDGSHDAEMLDVQQDFEEQADTADLDEAEEEDIKPAFRYPTGYPLESEWASPYYKEVHELRREVAETLHSVHEFLCAKQEDDVTCFSSLYMAYRSWFLDVGMERSAHVLDRLTRLLISDIQFFKLNGLRKDYPRPLLVRRANLYHVQRLRHNSCPRQKTVLEEALLLDLAQSSVSVYTDIRRTAQSAQESAIKAILGARPLIIPPLLEALQKAVKVHDFPRIKGALYSLLFGSVTKTIARDWRFAPALIKAFIEVTGADRPSVQKLASSATFTVMDFGRPLQRLVILDRDTVEAIAPVDAKQLKTGSLIAQKIKKIRRKRQNVEERKAKLAVEVVDLAAKSHWRKATRAATILMYLGLRFETIAPEGMIDLVTVGAINDHPRLRGLYSGAFVALLTTIDTRAAVGHSYERYLRDDTDIPGRVDLATRRDEESWTEEFLAQFAQPDAKYYFDNDYPGWLVWRETLPAYVVDAKTTFDYDNLEQSVRGRIGKHLDRKWFATYFTYLKQEPRDQGEDQFRMSSAMMLGFAFGLLFSGLTPSTFADIKELVQEVFGDGSDKHQHRAAAEIIGALLSETPAVDTPLRTSIWEYVFPIIRGIISDGLTPENSSYWTTLLQLVLQGSDPRRSWPLVDWLASFRLDMSSNAAFKESSRVQLLQQCIVMCGWHFQLGKPILSDFLSHLDHPYKGVREAIGQTICNIYRSTYHESYKDVDTLLESQRQASSTGSAPYAPTNEFRETVHKVFSQLERWRKERPAGQQTPSSYTLASKTVLIWLDGTMRSQECITLIEFFPDVIMEELLHMMDVKEDPELQALAYHVFLHLPNVPHRAGEDTKFIQGLIRIGKTSLSWHQRLRVLINMQVLFFRQLFLMSRDDQQALMDCVTFMLSDPQSEVRLGASTTLSGMIRCAPLPLREPTIEALKTHFTTLLQNNPVSKMNKGRFAQRTPGTLTPSTVGSGGYATPNSVPESTTPELIPGTPTSSFEHNKVVLARHAAVLGLGALVQAFPYLSPPPAWLPEVLATLALKAAGDAGVVGKSVKSILADFKKTRQDTWHIDKLAFTQEQLEDLEGVLWKSYFA